MDNLYDDMFAEAKQSFISGNYKIAEPILQQMILQGTRNPEVFQMFATICYDKGQFNKAIKTFKRALEIDPTYTDASVGLSIILNDLGRYEEGKEVFNTAQSVLNQRKGQKDPFLEEKIATKHEELADLYFQIQSYNEALDQLLKAQKISNRKAEISLRVSECFVKLNDNNRAIQTLQTLIREYPQFNQARLKLGMIHYNMQNLAEAVHQWENILLREPRHSEANRLLKMAQAVGITTMENYV
jgi:tetratricopeptide (TPR) repeat protein